MYFLIFLNLNIPWFLLANKLHNQGEKHFFFNEIVPLDTHSTANSYHRYQFPPLPSSTFTNFQKIEFLSQMVIVKKAKFRAFLEILIIQSHSTANLPGFKFDSEIFYGQKRHSEDIINWQVSIKKVGFGNFEWIIFLPF